MLQETCDREEDSTVSALDAFRIFLSVVPVKVHLYLANGRNNDERYECRCSLLRFGLHTYTVLRDTSHRKIDDNRQHLRGPEFSMRSNPRNSDNSENSFIRPECSGGNNSKNYMQRTPVHWDNYPLNWDTGSQFISLHYDTITSTVVRFNC